MNLGLIIIICIIIILVAFFRNKIQNEDKNNENEEMNDTNENNIEMEEIFFEQTKNGENTYKIMNIFNQFDLMFVKSLFQSEQIPFYIESEHISRIRPGMQIGSFGNSSVYILEKDYNDVIKIIEEYKKNKEKNYIEKPTIRKPLEVLFGAFPVPESNDINGIVILYKK